MVSFKLLSLAFIATAYADEPCDPCQPQGATGTNPPSVGSDLSSLYINLLASVKGVSYRKRNNEPLRVRQTTEFCCRQNLDCVNVQSLNIPMCYDKFTTNFLLADGSYGSLTTGKYTSDSSLVDLFSGEYSGGNIYSNDPQEKPNTATLSLPPQFTGTGVGGAIPASELGSIVVYTTTIPGTTITAPTVLAGSTITQATTIAPQTSVVTSTIGGAVASNTNGADTSSTNGADASSTNGAAASSKGAAAGQSVVDSTGSIALSVFSALMYALYAL